mmetsp:Transcript_10285/g.18742  ORF Transcript_10285/g.18742 Transcript_10285/m.18742 type:complete len:93 (+) Transcript_10285:550-828(+)
MAGRKSMRSPQQTKESPSNINWHNTRRGFGNRGAGQETGKIAWATKRCSFVSTKESTGSELVPKILVGSNCPERPSWQRREAYIQMALLQIG